MTKDNKAMTAIGQYCGHNSSTPTPSKKTNRTIIKK